MTRRRSRRCWSSCSWRRTSGRRRRSSSISTPPTIRCTGIRKGASSTAITTATAICRSTCSAAGICWRPSCGRANIDASAGSIEEVARIVRQIRARWPDVRIVLRADSGFAREALMAWCETNRVDYLFGLARNARLVAEIEEELAAARAAAEKTGQPARRFKDFTWSTLDSWSRERRVVAKAEWTQGEANPRFVVTSLAQRGGGAAALRGHLLRPRRHGEPHQGMPARPLRRPHLGRRPCAPTSCGCGSPRWPMC